MKKNVLVIAGLAVLSTNAFASKARMQALGQGFQSLYVQDTRSVFVNPAAVNDSKNYIVTEWGTSGAADTDAAPRAEGGFFREMGAFNYGLYLGSDVASTTSANANFLTKSNTLDLFLGGDMGMKWGARLQYASSKDEQTAAFTKKHDALGIGVGVMHGDIEGYANIELSNKATGATVAADESKQKPSYQIGGSYKFNGWSLLADYQSSKRDETVGGATVSGKFSTIYVGAGRVHEVAAGSRLNTDVGFMSDKSEDTVGAGTDDKTTSIPVTLGMEADATSWLTLRGSVGQNIIGSTKNKAGKVATVANSTAVNAGATLNFGKLKVDGVIGNTDGARNAGAVGNTTNVGVLTTDNLMTRVGVTYNF